MKARINIIVVTVVGVWFLCGDAWSFSGSGSGTESDPYVITDVYELQEMQDDLGAWYVLGNDVDASETSSWNAGAGFEPIKIFVGTFDGRDHVISGLYIDRMPDYGIGLFGSVGSAAIIKNVGLVDSYVNGRMAVGALAGHSEGFISDCYAMGIATAEADVGGLVGYTNKIVTRCYSSGNVIAGGRTGGFTSAGGLIGLTRGPDSVISNCYSTAEVRSTTANYQTGGFIGINKDTVYNCYSTGRVTAARGSRSGGFCSLNQGRITSCYWDILTSGEISSSGGTGKTTDQMMQQSTFVNWDFVDIWDIVEGVTYPFFREAADLVGLEIIGPNEVAEDFGAQYKAIAYYDNNSTADVTTLAQWSVEPNSLASIEGGLLTTEGINRPEEEVTIYAQYTEDTNSVEAEKAVTIFAVCPTGSALEFDGVDDYIEVADDDSLTPSSELTISAWVYINNISWRDRTAIVCKYDAGSGDRAYMVQLGKNNKPNKSCVSLILSQTLSPFNGKQSYGITQLEPGRWYHISATFEANHQEIYVNGVEETDDTDSSIADSIPNNDDSLYIAYIKDEDTYFNGKIDDVRIYNRALSAEEVWANMHTRLAGDEPGLIGYWDFDEGEGQVAYDLSGNGNLGYLGSDPCEMDDSDPAWVESDAPIGICTLEGFVERNITDARDIKLDILGLLEIALDKEKSAKDVLNTLFKNRGFGSVKKGDVVKAKQNIHSAIQSEEQAGNAVDKSLDKLEDSLNELGYEVEQ